MIMKLVLVQTQLIFQYQCTTITSFTDIMVCITLWLVCFHISFPYLANYAAHVKMTKGSLGSKTNGCIHVHKSKLIIPLKNYIYVGEYNYHNLTRYTQV